MRDEGLVKGDEPFKHLLTQGMVLKDGTKMSKSKGNTVDPQGLIDLYGADTARLFITYAAPPEQSLEWSDSGVEGQFKFLKRLWNLVQKHLAESGDNSIAPLDKGKLTKSQKELRFKLHKTIDEVADDMGRRFTFNTAIAKIRELLNLLDKLEMSETQSIRIRQDVLEKVIIMLSPIVPHITHDLWQQLPTNGIVIDQSWPEVDKSALVQDTIQYMIQVNGKLRDKIEVENNTSKESIEQQALASEIVQRNIEGKTIRKVIVVPKRLVNIVAN
jgi:leucyl-tRNA synthetase